MSAQGDLKNHLQKAARHHAGRLPWKSVEDSPDAGKYLGKEDDPSLRLCVAGAQGVPADPAVAAVLASATEVERRVLTLLLQGEFCTAVIADVMDLADRPRTGKSERSKN